LSARDEVKLRIAKRAVNDLIRFLDRLVPSSKPPYSEAVALVDRIFARVERRVRKERRLHPRFELVNLVEFVRVLRKLVVFLMNWDVYYERWVRYVLVVTVDECAREFSQLDADDTDAWVMYVEELTEALGKVLLPLYLRERARGT